MPVRRPMQQSGSVKTRVKQALNLSKRKNPHPRYKRAAGMLQELFNEINPLHMKRSRGQLTAEEAAELKKLERTATTLLEKIEQV